MSNNLPNVLYKYRYFDTRTLHMLENNQIYFASPLDFNDPFDCLAQEHMHDNFIEDMAKVKASLNLGVEPFLLTDVQVQPYREKLKSDPELIQTAEEIKSAMNELRDSLGVVCFSARNDSILMWSHYADMHKGFCIGFSSNRLGVPVDDIREVMYSKDRNLNFSFNLMSTEGMTEEIFGEEFRKEHLLTKFIDWQYEEERRLIGVARKIATYPEGCIEQIIFGLNMPKESREQIMFALKGKAVNYFESVKSTKDFAIEIRKIED